MNNINERLMRMLKVVYFEREHAPIDSQWQDNVMLQIRQLDLDRVQPSFGLLMERFLWRMAPTLAVLTVAVGVGVVSVGVLPEYDLLQALGYRASMFDFLGFFSN